MYKINERLNYILMRELMIKLEPGWWVNIR